MYSIQIFLINFSSHNNAQWCYIDERYNKCQDIAESNKFRYRVFTNKISVSSSGADAIVSTLLNLLAYSLFHNSLSIFGINEIAGNHGTIVVKLTLGF